MYVRNEHVDVHIAPECMLRARAVQYISVLPTPASIRPQFTNLQNSVGSLTMTRTALLLLQWSAALAQIFYKIQHSALSHPPKNLTHFFFASLDFSARKDGKSCGVTFPFRLSIFRSGLLVHIRVCVGKAGFRRAVVSLGVLMGHAGGRTTPLLYAGINRLWG